MALLPIMACLLVSFLTVGMGLPVLPLHVSQALGLGPFVVGLVTGSQFAAALISRVWAGRYTDGRGSKRAVVVGLLATSVAGMLYAGSLLVEEAPEVSAAVLMLGRGMLGAGESFVITGAVAWGMGLAGRRSAGQAISLIGTAMFAALAVGAPIGTGLYAVGGFGAIAAATAVAPLLTIVLIAPVASAAPGSSSRPTLASVARVVWLPGVGAALSSVGFGAIVAFGSLLFAERGWHPVWLPFCAFAVALIATRLFSGNLIDRVGGARVALVCTIVQSVGLALVWLASGPGLATAGAALAGLGYALVYPGLGSEAIHRAPVESRGLAMGTFTVFLDVALGLSGPGLGALAAEFGLGRVFLCSAMVVLGASVVAAALVVRGRYAP